MHWAGQELAHLCRPLFLCYSALPCLDVRLGAAVVVVTIIFDSGGVAGHGDTPPVRRRGGGAGAYLVVAVHRA